ncbi:MAG: DMT family transporter [Elusimicrobiota bacterium]
MNKKSLYFQILTATLIWGAAYPFTKHVVSIISPLSLVFIRSIIGSFLLLIFIKPDFKKFLKISILLKLLVMSILGVSVQQFSQCYALKYTTSTNAGFIIALTPIVVVFIELFLGSKIDFNKFIGFLFGFSGCLIVMYSIGKLDLSMPSTQGDLIFLTSAFTWAGYVVLTKRWFKEYSQKEVTALTMFIAFLTIIPFEFKYNLISEVKNLDKLGWISLLYLSFLSSFIGYMFWNNAVEGLGPVKSSYFIYDEPFATIISAYFVLDEKILPLTFLGGVLILIGVFFVLKRENNKKISYECL